MTAPPPRVLLYHCVGPDGGPPDKMVTPASMLEEHVATLRGLGYRFITAGELAREWPPPDGTAVLTFDDGWRDALTTATPLLARLGVRATFFVCPGGFGGRHERGPLLTEADAHALHESGMELASHTLSHRNVLELSDADLHAEFAGSREAIEAITGEPCLTLAYPTGRHDARVERAAEAAGYALAFAARPGPLERYAVPRVQPYVAGKPEGLLDRLGLA